MQQAIDILDEMIEETIFEESIRHRTLTEVKERIQALDGGDTYHIFGGKRNRIKRLKFLEEKLDEGLSWTDISKLTGRDRTVEFNFHKKWIHLLDNEGDGWIPFEIPPEKEGMYLTYGDDLNNNVGPRVMNYVNGTFECGDGAEFPTHWKHIGPLPLPPVTK